MAGGVELNQEHGELGHRSGLGVNDGNLGKIAERIRRAEPVLGAFQLEVHGRTIVHDAAPVPREHPHLSLYRCPPSVTEASIKA